MIDFRQQWLSGLIGYLVEATLMSSLKKKRKNLGNKYVCSLQRLFMWLSSFYVIYV